VVNVILGQPSELGFQLSKFSALPAGAITFKVKNVGLGYHNFKLCTAPVASAKLNTCVGKATKVLKTGQIATLTVVLKNGKYEFICSVPGHAAAGMKGLLGVGVKVVAPKQVMTATAGSNSTATKTGGTTKTTTTPAGGGGGGGGGVAVGECPAGMTIVQGAAAIGGDHDDDDDGGPTDGDGCL
jgi:plastocyanin